MDTIATPRTVAIVDNEPIPRSGLEHLAAKLPAMTVAASVSWVDDLDMSAQYDVVLLHLPSDTDGMAVKTITRIAQIGPPVVISAWDRPPGLLTAARAGARGCVLRQSTHDTVARAVSVVAAGGFYLCESLIDRFQLELSRSTGNDTHGLGPREVETLRWVARGLTHAEIAKRMGLTRTTINTYVKRIRGKLKVNSRSDLIRIAIELGELTVERGVAA
ncbi:response regulator transcription factor [Rugosimonospora acidiphila]|uniref:Response regulator transcription factor n=1 Tax=Rugosimonospora acidiphila TaxID=556531 RepID=A0ABP9SS93_9ACTN